ncbi:hypothetical protein EON82_00190 [bacterium]|nr:MAG: hypothetical protein EON82_00190 [bacterium]
MTGTSFSKIAAALALGTTSLGLASTSNAQSLNDLINRRQDKKNQWRNLAIGGGALGVLGLLTKNSTLTYLGLGGGLYSVYRYEQDRKSQSKLAQQRASLFNRSSFTHNGKRYVRKTKWKNGKKYYQFVRA